MKVLRRIGAVIAGLIVAAVLVEGAEAIVHSMHPFPPGVDQHDMAQIKKFVSTLPADALVLVLAGWLLATIAGTFTAAKIAGTRVPGYVLGAILLAAGIANSIIIPQPLWFSIVSFVIYIGGTFAGVGLARPRAGVAA
jgi:hypothetical protein